MTIVSCLETVKAWIQLNKTVHAIKHFLNLAGRLPYCPFKRLIDYCNSPGWSEIATGRQIEIIKFT